MSCESAAVGNGTFPCTLLGLFVWVFCGVDRDTKRLHDVLAGAQDGPNQEHLIWSLWVGFDDCAFIGIGWWRGFGFIHHKNVDANCIQCPKLSVMPMSGFMALVTGLNATWMQFLLIATQTLGRHMWLVNWRLVVPG